MAANTASVTPLNGSNYPTWKVHCQMAVIKDGWWGIVNGTETRPPASESEKYIKFNTRWDRAWAIIVLSIDSSLLY